MPQMLRGTDSRSMVTASAHGLKATVRPDHYVNVSSHSVTYSDTTPAIVSLGHHVTSRHLVNTPNSCTYEHMRLYIN